MGVRGTAYNREGSRDNFGESLETCQLLSHSRGFLFRLQIFKSTWPSLWISLAHKAPSYDTKMPLRVVFDKKVFVKFYFINIINNFKTNDETQLKTTKNS
jgi:hypothetical protein